MFGKDLLVRMLDRRDTLPPDEIALIEALPVRPVTFGPDEEIVREGSRTAESCLVANGFAVRNQAIREGKRQITAKWKKLIAGQTPTDEMKNASATLQIYYEWISSKYQEITEKKYSFSCE